MTKSPRHDVDCSKGISEFGHFDRLPVIDPVASQEFLSEGTLCKTHFPGNFSKRPGNTGGKGMD